MQETKTDLKLNALRLLILVSERSQTQAAESLRRTQSSISQQITALEREVDRKLFETKSHRDVPTKAGEVLIAYARQIIALHDAADLRFMFAGLVFGRLVYRTVFQDFSNPAP
jgi:DNA-binding transcriptional LysR family regulator